MCSVAEFLFVFAFAGFALGTPARDQFDSLGGPLILTPYIEAGKIEEGRKLAAVTGIKPHVDSYAGFFNVDKKCDSNLFFWYFPSQTNPKEDPVSVWLNGGPGTSSTLGLLYENGPYELTPNDELKLREYSWTRNSSVVYFDNPVGTGYSFTKGSLQDCYAWNQTQVGQSFLRALEQFFKLFPEVSDNPFYLTGESYAGKYIPGIAHTIHISKTSVKLTGMAIGNGWIEPYNQLTNSNLYYHLGYIDEKRRVELRKKEDQIRDLIRQSRFVEAKDKEAQALRHFCNITGFTKIYNYLYLPAEERPDYVSFMNRTDIRKALHIGNATLHNGELPKATLAADNMKSIRPWLETLMNHYRVLLYFGQMDLRVAYAASLDFLRALSWKFADEYAKTDRMIYKVGSDVAGYFKTAGNFTEMLIRNAGHMVPTNQPEWALDMYNKFIFNIPFGR